MRIALYARVSTDRQTQGQTIDQQLDRLHAHLHTQGWAVAPEHVFRDDGYSGATLQRPGLTRLREAVAHAEVDRLVLTAPDRLARNYVHLLLLLEEFTHAGCPVDFLERPMSQDPHDQLVLQIRGAVAEYERSLIADRMRRGRLQKLKAGILLPWTRAPYGYVVDPTRPRDPAGVRREEFAAAVVGEMFAYYAAAGHSLQSVAKDLMARQIPAPHGQARWNQATIRGLLSNPVYTGRVYANRQLSQPAQQRQSALAPVGHTGGHTLRPASEWLLVAEIPALVSQEVFDQVQAKLAQNQAWASRNNTRQEYLLRALVSCGHCRLSCFGRSDGRKGYAYYVCRGKLHPVVSCRDTKCTARLIPAAQLDALVWADLCALLQEPEQITAALQRAQQGAWLPQELAARRTTLRQAQSALAQQVDRLTEAYLAQVIPLDEYKRRRGDLEARQAVLSTQLAQVAAQAERANDVAGLGQGIEEFCTRVQTGLAAADFAQRRALVELLIDRVVVTGEEVEIRYVIPTSVRGEQVRFCHLRLDYFDLPARSVQA